MRRTRSLHPLPARSRRSSPGLPAAVVLSLALAAAACNSTPRDDEADVPYPVLEGADFGGMQNVAHCGHVWVGSRPRVADLELAVRRGVRTLVDVTAPSTAGRDELAAAAADLGLEYVAIGTESGQFEDADVQRFVETLSAARDTPVLVFCDNGGRSAKLLAIFRVVFHGVPLQAALDDARRGGMKPGADEEFVRSQVARLRDGEPPADEGVDLAAPLSA